MRSRHTLLPHPSAETLTVPPRLGVREPGDRYEHEADYVAAGSVPAQLSSLGNEIARAAAPPSVGAVLRSPGEPLDAATRAFMEPRFGHDFGAVRVHRDGAAAASSQELCARAYTVGPHVVFGAGEFQPGSGAGRQLLAHELSHTIQQGAAGRPAVQRAMKFEIQTENVVKRKRGASSTALPRKFGPAKTEFLHKGSKGKPAKGGKEGTAIELQSEAHGFVEFETPSWLRKWCEVKDRIEEAQGMVDAINHADPVDDPTSSFPTVKFPFDVKHLAKAKGFSGGLKPDESLVVEIRRADWRAKIQASESFKLEDFGSYLKEHMASSLATSITGSAKKVLDAANTAGLPEADLVHLSNLLQIILEYITEVQRQTALYKSEGKYAAGHPAPLAKEHLSLMSRTNFSSMYRELLTPDEKKLFRDIVASDVILTEIGATRATRVYPERFTGYKSPGPKIYDWLVSIHKTDRDLLSSLGGDNRAMGRFDVETKAGEKDTNLVKFEARSTKHGPVRPVTEWLDFAREVFTAAHAKRPRTDGTELIYEPDKCSGAKKGPRLGTAGDVRIGVEFSPDTNRLVASGELKGVLAWADAALSAGLKLDIPMTSQSAFVRAGLRGGAEYRLLDDLYGQLSAGGFIESSGGGGTGRFGYELGAGIKYDTESARLGALYNYLKSDPTLERHQLLVEVGFRWQ